MVTAIRHGDEGKAVTELQRALIMLGHELPRYGPDGDAGDETFEAVNEFCRARSIPQLPDFVEIPQVLVEVLLTLGQIEIALHEIRKHEIVEAGPPALPSWMYDYRDKNTDRQGSKRSIHEVTGITLHQMATDFQGKRALDRVARIKVHHSLMRDGRCTYNAPYTRRMAQAQRVFNRTDIGVEVNGYYAGVDGDARTFWKPKSRPNRKPMDLTAELVENGRALIRFIVETVAAQGGEIRHIHAHRQTSRSRTSDPGELIWKALGVWAKDTFGLTYEVDGGGQYVPHKRNRSGKIWTTSGPGRPIPTQWDPEQPRDYRHKPKA